MQSTIATTCLVNVSEDVSEVVSLGITFDKIPLWSILEIEHKGQFNEVNEVLSSGIRHIHKYVYGETTEGELSLADLLLPHPL